MQLIITKAIESKYTGGKGTALDYNERICSEVEFSYNGHKYWINETYYNPDTIINGFDTDYECVIYYASSVDEIASMIVNNEPMREKITTKMFFTMIAALIDNDIKSISGCDAFEIQPLNDVEILLQY